MNRDTEVFAAPVELPEGLHHGGATAYGRYKCRCRYCVKWRRLYDQMLHFRRAAEVKVQKRGAKDYLAHRGIQVHGPGPFYKNPYPLAKLVAKYFNDDLTNWKGED